jgi:hypothetical protein
MTRALRAQEPTQLAVPSHLTPMGGPASLTLLAGILQDQRIATKMLSTNLTAMVIPGGARRAESSSPKRPIAMVIVDLFSAKGDRS